MIDVLLVLVVLSLVLYWYLARTDVPRSMWAIAFGGFLARVAFVLVDDVLGVFGLRGDAVRYERMLWYVAEQWQAGVFDAPLHIASGAGALGYYKTVYSTVLSPVYFLFGRSPVLARLTMALLGALVVVNVYLIGRELFDSRSGLYAAAIAAAFPYWIYVSGILYRDTLVVLFLSWTVYYLLRWQAEGSRRALALGLGAAVCGLSLRMQNVPLVAVLFAVAVYGTVDLSVRQAVATAVGMLGAFAVFLVRYGDQLSVGRLAARRRRLARENPAAYLTEFAYESLPELVAFAPIGVLYFLLVPFPWQTVNTLAVVSIYQNLFVWYPVLLLSVLGVRDALTVGAGPRRTLPLVAFVLSGLVIYGLVEGNIGPAMRHRTQFQFVVFAFAGVALARRVRVRAAPWARDATQPSEDAEPVA